VPSGVQKDPQSGGWPTRSTAFLAKIVAVRRIPLRVLAVQKHPSKEVGEKPGPVRYQATIAAISGLVPTMLMTRVRL